LSIFTKKKNRGKEEPGVVPHKKLELSTANLAGGDEAEQTIPRRIQKTFIRGKGRPIPWKGSILPQKEKRGKGKKEKP